MTATGAFALVAGQGRLHRVNGTFVVCVGFPLLDGDGTLRTIAQAGAQAVTKIFTDQAGLAVNDPYRAFGARRNTEPATVTEFLVDPNNLPNRHLQPPE